MSAFIRVKTIAHHFVLMAPLLFASLTVADQAGRETGGPEPDSAIGKVAFAADCAPEAATQFDGALALMHHMMYEQARAQFEAIAQAHPDCAMAHWGIATSLFQPLWSTTPSAAAIERGRTAISRAESLAESQRERLLIEATSTFFTPEDASPERRLTGWVEGMEAAWRAHGDDADVAALYALSLLTRARSAADQAALHDEAESVLREVWEATPTHPGAVHYTIHATDADGRADNAPVIVAAYAEIAPSVPHALHMPSHIYVRLGDWPAVIEWNTRSAVEARDHQVDGATSFHYIHAMDYRVYGHLQRGEDSAARDVLKTALANGPHQANFPGAYHLAALPARLAVERRDWQAARAVEPRTPTYIGWDGFYWPEALSHFARGLGAVFQGDMDAAREAEDQLAGLVAKAESASDPRFAVYIEIDRQILAGWLAHAVGDDRRATELMRAAARLEAGVEKHPVTPGAVYPPNEALGDLLSHLQRPNEALVAYRASDAMWPRRYNTIAGAMQAARDAGDDRAAAEWAERLLAVAPNAERPANETARQLADR